MNNTAPQWNWPSDLDPQIDPSARASESPEPTPTQRRKRYYKPRQCRICLEEVLPTTELDDSLTGRVFSSRVRVSYVSDDPELGRLLSPCLCKGSQQFVHEGCLRAWRNVAPADERHFYRCPTCKFEYRLERLRWSRWLSSKTLRLVLTIIILTMVCFVLGFVSEPIIKYLSDPFSTLYNNIFYFDDIDYWDTADEPSTDFPIDTEGWAGHFIKGLASLGILGFLQSVLTMNPFRMRWWRFDLRRERGRRNTIQNISWVTVAIGVITVIFATWKLLDKIATRTLQRVSDRVIDVQDVEADEEDEDGEYVASDSSKKFQ